MVEVNTGVPVQVASPGPKTLKVMVPVGLTPPERVAVSVMVPPTGHRRRGDGHDGRAAWVTTTLSLAAPQALVAAVVVGVAAVDGHELVGPGGVGGEAAPRCSAVAR